MSTELTASQNFKEVIASKKMSTKNVKRNFIANFGGLRVAPPNTEVQEAYQGFAEGEEIYLFINKDESVVVV